jgi:hypothetical protein
MQVDFNTYCADLTKEIERGAERCQRDTVSSPM